MQVDGAKLCSVPVGSIMGTLLWVSVAATGAHNYSYPSTIACCAYMCLMYYWIMRGYVCRGMFGLAIDY